MGVEGEGPAVQGARFRIDAHAGPDALEIGLGVSGRRTQNAPVAAARGVRDLGQAQGGLGGVTATALAVLSASAAVLREYLRLNLAVEEVFIQGEFRHLR